MISLSLSRRIVAAVGLATLVLSGGIAYADDIEAVLIHKTMWLCGDEAVLVIDPGAVGELTDLVLNNKPPYAHACGYHWSIGFIHRDGTIEARGHNIDCQTYPRSNSKAQALLNGYFSQALQAPKAFIVDLTVRSTMPPKEVSKVLAHHGRVVLLDGPTGRLPSVRLGAMAERPIPDDRGQLDAAKSANEAASRKAVDAASAILVRKFGGAIPAQDESGISSLGKGKIMDEFQRTFFLPFGSPLTDLPVFPSTIKVVKTTEAPKQYVIQLITTVRPTEAALALLSVDHPFVLAASSFGKGCVRAK